jgi:hypothetical protein
MVSCTVCGSILSCRVLGNAGFWYSWWYLVSCRAPGMVFLASGA